MGHIKPPFWSMANIMCGVADILHGSADISLGVTNIYSPNTHLFPFLKIVLDFFKEKHTPFPKIGLVAEKLITFRVGGQTQK